ncbi:MAG TPA: PspC domain-containing protein [Actinomycetota bacterium]|nr:PspC domain-containing protein [Actinomycetota bacterium]
METENIALPGRSPSDQPAGGFSRYGLFRSRDRRLIAGVAGGIGERFGIDPVLVRIAFIILTLSGFAGLVLYAVLWAMVPEENGTARRLPPGAQRAAAMGMIVLGVMILLRPLGLWLGDTAAASLSLAALGGGVIWLNSPASTRQRWSRNIADRLPDGPLEALGLNDRVGRMRMGAGALFVLGGILLFIQRSNLLIAALGNEGSEAVRQAFPDLEVLTAMVLAVAATLIGLGIIAGPWVWRLILQLTNERRERIRSQERAEMAAHLHDSVLQTLALIQRTDQPREMVALARNQERELRAWLNGTPTFRDQMLSGAIEEAASAVELQFKVPIEVVTVGDAQMDEHLQAIVDACREATVNAAKHSGADQISVYMEVEPDAINTFIRDDGAGFEPAAVAPDRRGIAESIKGRMERSGGSAIITTEPGGGTEVQLTMARTR